MHPKWLQTRNFWAGVLYVAVGAIALSVGQSYPMGTTARMGSGYFPKILSLALVALGLVSVARSIFAQGALVERIQLKPALMIPGAAVLFGILLPVAGLIAALAVLILMSASASRFFHPGPKAIFGMIALIFFSALVFVLGLGVPMPIFGSLFNG